MLQLDLKQVRKGKPIGLPYQGSKKKISKQIVQIIKQNFGEGRARSRLAGGVGQDKNRCERLFMVEGGLGYGL